MKSLIHISHTPYIHSTEFLNVQKRSTMEGSSFVMKSLPFVLMIAAQFVLIGSATLTKAALIGGLSQYVYIAYYQALGTIMFIPWFVCHSLSGKRLPLSFALLGRFFILGLIGSCISPICIVTGLSYTSVTLVAILGNLNPIFTFLIAICFRMEKLDLKKTTDQIKILGALVAVSGAFVVTLYKGPALLPSHEPLTLNSSRKLSLEQHNWPLGCVLLTIGFLLRSIFNILQADTAKLYPDEVTIVFFNNVFGTIQTAVASLFLVKGSRGWQLHSKVEIIAIVYSAFAMTVLISILLTWCLRKKGAVFVSMFDPMNVAIAAFMGFVFLADGVYLGSVVGSTAIIAGFYAVMWGQAKTTIEIDNKTGWLEAGSSSSQVTPLLQKV